MDDIRTHIERSGRELIDATRPYAEEQTLQSWWVFGSTFFALGATALAVLRAPWLPLRLALGAVEGLIIVRAFILFHDHLHGALLRKSKFAKWSLYLLGMFTLTPPTVWRQTHNYHHANTAKVVGSHIGSFPVLTTDLWKMATPAQKVLYRITRHPLSMLLGYFTVFLYGMCISPLRRNPRKHWDAALTLLFHAAMVAALTHWFGWAMCFQVLIFPLMVAFAAGSYLFYAQHNFPEMQIQSRQSWTYTRAALESSSYMKLGPVMAWFTGNIGYHHVHHLNPTIPFYRLPEAMAAIPELQHPGTTTLHPSDIAACLRLGLWDAEQNRMVPIP